MKAQAHKRPSAHSAQIQCSALSQAEGINSPAIEIYALCCPYTAAVRYVGKAADSRARLRRHLLDSRRRNTPVYRWIRGLLVADKIPELRVIETCTLEAWPDRERYWIDRHRQDNYDLLNVADGGDEPHCPPDVRSRNAAIATARRMEMHAADPKRKRLLYLKQQMGRILRFSREHGDQAMLDRQLDRMRFLAAYSPKMFGSWALL